MEEKDKKVIIKAFLDQQRENNELKKKEIKWLKVIALSVALLSLLIAIHTIITLVFALN